jgi:hypothetical protein
MKTWFSPSPGPPTMRRLEPLGLRQNEQRTVRLTETCGVGLGLLGESDVEVCMTSSVEPNAPPVNQRSACAPYRLRAAAVHRDPRMPTVEGVVADGGRDPPKIG